MSATESSSNSRKLLRQQVRSLRRALSQAEQESAARRVADIALSQREFPLGRHVALYMAADGEVDATYLIQGLLEQGIACYLPVLEEETVTLAFRRFLPDQPLVTNSFGLLEPGTDAPVIAPADLSLVFLPLVAFDLEGNRLGMGKGYYDRTFEFMREPGAKGPALVGLAHECQRVERLEAARWDVPLEGIVTGRDLYRFG